MTKRPDMPGFERQLLQGNTWMPPHGVRPCLQCAMKIRERNFIRIRPVTHGCWALDYSYNTGMEVRVGAASNPWQMRPARIAHLYPPGKTYWERRDARTFPLYHEDVFVMFQCGDTLAPLIDPRTGYARFMDSGDQLENLLAEAARVGAAFGGHGFWKGQAILCNIFDLLLAARRVDHNIWRIPGADDEHGPSDFSRAVERYFRERLSERITLADIARHAHVSASTLTHRYHVETGHTPMDTLRNLRLTVAKGLLTKGWKLKEIAGQTGFVDAFHFSRTFKRVVGLSPREFCMSLRDTPASTNSRATVVSS